MFDLLKIESIIVILLRVVWPFLGGAAVMNESELLQLGGALATVGWVGYHAVKRYQGKRHGQ